MFALVRQVRHMLLRLLLAIVGGCVITGTMLISMSEISALFRERSADKIFLINDILPAPEKGRPRRPPAAALPPQRETPALDRQETLIRVQGIDDPGSGVAVEAAPPVPRLQPE